MNAIKLERIKTLESFKRYLADQIRPCNYLKGAAIDYLKEQVEKELIEISEEDQRAKKFIEDKDFLEKSINEAIQCFISQYDVNSFELVRTSYPRPDGRDIFIKYDINFR